MVLLTLTVVSVVAAAAFAWVAWRLREDERRRSEARIAALSSAIDAVESVGDSGAQHPVVVTSLFAPQHSAAANGAPIIKIAAGVAMAVVLLVVIAMSGRGRDDASASSRGEAAVAETTARRASANAAAPLELISMRHEREGDTLKVSGLVRNPRDAASMTRVSAVVLAFDRSGAFVASGRAGLDFTTLEAGDESPFVVTVSGGADVARYRVSFRTETGVVQHVDRRAEQMRLSAFAGAPAGRRGHY